MAGELQQKDNSDISQLTSQPNNHLPDDRWREQNVRLRLDEVDEGQRKHERYGTDRHRHRLVGRRRSQEHPNAYVLPTGFRPGAVETRRPIVAFYQESRTNRIGKIQGGSETLGCVQVVDAFRHDDVSKYLKQKGPMATTIHQR